MANAEQFIKLYTTLEAAVRKKYKYEDHPIRAAAEHELSQYKDELDTLRNLRNVLSHSRPFGIEYCTEPHDKLIKSLKMILEDVDDTLIIKNCVKFSDVKYANYDDSVLECMNAMRDNVYTHIPILDEKRRVVGVFGESTLFALALDRANDNDLFLLDKTLKFRDIKEHIALDAQKTEKFIFMSKYSTILDCHYNFKKVFESKEKRLGMIFITENGKDSEALLGILTAWGVLGREMLE